MKAYILTAIACIFFLVSCKKSETDERRREDYSYSGTVYDCNTGKPIPGVKFRVINKRITNAGFGNRSVDGGAYYTDANGQFDIRPYALGSKATHMDFELSVKGYHNAHITAPMDRIEIPASGVIPFNVYLSRGTILKLTMNNVNYINDDDRLHFFFYEIGGDTCAYTDRPDFYGSSGGNGGDELRGMANEVRYYNIKCGDSTFIIYYGRHGSTNFPKTRIDIPCYGKDTVEAVINY